MNRFFSTYIPKLEANTDIFTNVKNRIKVLCDKCYNFDPVTVDISSADENIFQFFEASKNFV